ncbi:hypothetical protein F3Y22_tig00009019pilonHSYRG00014 [Hibiscus syriacus]|uniref:Retroviral polymerase SH3-like domain-containing protein n=1 Tax=Hibiscus syriacus TaxID=106335 RepID=A0A6A3C8I9_HIBSY|nr:hypothetical protein F3Y22_tig00009019pilonHSYRG00014 [Hibiscus syriacus]
MGHIKIFQSDDGGEFFASALGEFLKKKALFILAHGYKCYYPPTKKLFVSMDVTFFEHDPYFFEAPIHGDLDGIFLGLLNMEDLSPVALEDDGGKETSLACIDKEKILTTIEAAMKDPMWKRVVEEEIRALENNGTWIVTDLPHDKKFVGSDLGCVGCPTVTCANPVQTVQSESAASLYKDDHQTPGKRLHRRRPMNKNHRQ